MTISYTWNHITDLPDHWQELGNETLRHLTRLWEKQKDTLDAEAQKRFVKKMQRQWAIETGLIENLYTLDRGITLTLIEHGLNAIDIPHNSTNKSPGYVKRLIKDQEDVVEGLFDFVGGTRKLSTSYIKELHAQLTHSQDKTEGVDSAGRHIEILLRKGDWKTLPNNPTRLDGQIHEYCPPEHVASEIDQLLAWHHEHMERNVPPEVEAAWLHHRFAQIHPFQDGNGRVARALATLVFLKAGWFPPVVLNDDRKRYLDALESADNGDLKPLTAFFAHLAEKSFLKAISVSGGILDAQQERHNVVMAIQQTLIKKAAQRAPQTQTSVDLANALKSAALDIMRSMCNALAEAVAAADLGADAPKFVVRSSNEGEWHYFRSQIYTIGNQFDYYVNLEQYHEWLWLRIRKKDMPQYNIVLSLHSVSQNFSGVMAATMFLEKKEQTETMTRHDGPFALSAEAFVFTGEDNVNTVRPRFEEWVQAALNQGLAQWQQSL